MSLDNDRETSKFCLCSVEALEDNVAKQHAVNAFCKL